MSAQTCDPWQCSGRQKADATAKGHQGGLLGGLAAETFGAAGEVVGTAGGAAPVPGLLPQTQLGLSPVHHNSWLSIQAEQFLQLVCCRIWVKTTVAIRLLHMKHVPHSRAASG